MSDRYDITGIQGSTLLVTLSLKDSNGNFLDLSNYGVRGGVKEKFSSTGQLFGLNPQIISAASGIIQISGNSNATTGIPSNIYVYDIEVYNSGDYVFKPVGGYYLLFPESTNF